MMNSFMRVLGESVWYEKVGERYRTLGKTAFVGKACVFPPLTGEDGELASESSRRGVCRPCCFAASCNEHLRELYEASWLARRSPPFASRRKTSSSQRPHSKTSNSMIWLLTTRLPALAPADPLLLLLPPRRLDRFRFILLVVVRRRKAAEHDSTTKFLSTCEWWTTSGREEASQRRASEGQG